MKKGKTTQKLHAAVQRWKLEVFSQAFEDPIIVFKDNNYINLCTSHDKDLLKKLNFEIVI